MPAGILPSSSSTMSVQLFLLLGFSSGCTNIRGADLPNLSAAPLAESCDEHHVHSRPKQIHPNQTCRCKTKCSRILTSAVIYIYKELINRTCHGLVSSNQAKQNFRSSVSIKSSGAPHGPSPGPLATKKMAELQFQSEILQTQLEAKQGKCQIFRTLQLEVVAAD